MNLKDALRSLGILQIKNLDQVRKTYRKLALQYHPDHNPNDKVAEEKFRELKDAYDFVLETYKDEDLEVTDPGVSTKDSSGTESCSDRPDLNDLPLNLKYVMHINMLEAAEGCKKTIQYLRQNLSNDKETVRLSVSVPAGVVDGQKLRVKGEGSRDGKRPIGDLYVHIRINHHPLFVKEGRNLKMDLPISISDALFGCEKVIPTLLGSSRLKIPAGTKSGQILRLKGKGFPRVNGFGKGDFLIHIQLDLPLELSTEEKMWIQKISDKNSPLIEEYNRILKNL